MRVWGVVGAFLLFGAGLVYQFARLSDALATGYPPDISGHLTHDVDWLARAVCVAGGVLFLVLFPMMLRGWRGAAVVAFVMAVPYVGLGMLLRTPLLVVGAVAMLAVVVLAWRTRPSPAATTLPESPVPDRSRP